MRKLVALAFLLGVPAAAAEPLDEVVSKTLARAPALQAMLSRKTAALAMEREASWSRLPALSARTALTRGDDPVYAFGSLLRQRAFTAQDFAVDRLNWPGYRTNLQGAFEAGVPLFTAFELSSARDLARLAAQRAEAGGEGLSQSLRFQTAEAFLQVLLQRESLRALDERILSASKELENADRLRQKGLVLGSDYYAAEGILSGLKAWQAQLSAKLSEAGYRLGVLAGETLTPAGSLSEKPYVLPEADALLSQAFASRADLKAATVEERSAEVRRKRTDSSLLPRADAFAAIGVNSGDLSAAPSDRLVGVRLNLPFGDPAYPAKREGARALVEASRREREALGDEVKAQVLCARAGYLGAVSALPLLRTTLERSQKSLELFRPLYREGRQSVLEVLRAEEAVARARLQLLETLYGLHAGYAGLRLAAGTLDEGAIREVRSHLE